MAEKVDQDVREAAAGFAVKHFPPTEVHSLGGLALSWIKQGRSDDAPIVQAFARMKEAGRQQGLREAAEVARNPGFIEARDTEWDAGVNDAKRIIAAAITALMEGEGE